MEQEKEFEKIIKILKNKYSWDLDKLDSDTKSICEALLHYAIKAIKSELINTPQANEFSENVKSEMSYHLEKWKNEDSKPPHHFNMVLGFINGKLSKAIWEKDKEKFEHHLVTIAAVAGTAAKYFKQNDSEVNRWFK